ncbi:helix-turn-helix domain-containing protein [Desulfallas thermosapovorans]|uniref:Excisionase family DNA binding protein n=1 Tax=Desulfallas thermosapovorans DSM 6562 TaxID=1121431 RepID=A0A5S4ZW89_9FIRM|nr:helix-turn-helix domain-containing protein [Desulfallas thermosapovorans]TYO97045.1 excisionase family DNA binding protein [Desulfallas thermosapovorans DSM 6562]
MKNDIKQALRETIHAKEAAEMLGVSEWTIYDWARRKIIPHIKVGKRVLFRRSSILQWLDEQEAASLVQPEPVDSGKIRRLK